MTGLRLRHVSETLTPPHIAYVSLWFPKPSETFVLREVVNLRRAGLPISAYTLYGPARRNLSREMLGVSTDVKRLGSRAALTLARDMVIRFKADPAKAAALWREIPWRRWSSAAVAVENVWAFFCGFRLARLFEHDGVEHIHAPWANGPATAAWVASKLTGIPFSFSGRAGDIYPPDGALAEKMRDCSFVHTDNGVNVRHLADHAPDQAGKIHVIYNSLTLTSRAEAEVRMIPPYRFLAIGRLARTKGFGVLLRACAILKRENFPFHLTLVGDGSQGPVLRATTRLLGLNKYVSFLGFVSHDAVSRLLCSHDVCVVPSVVHRTGDRDGLPTVIMEALAHRLPVVATDVCGIPEVVRPGETGLLVPQRDPKALAEGLKAMVADRPAALRSAERGRELVLSLFDPASNTAAMRDLFLNHTRRPAYRSS